MVNGAAAPEKAMIYDSMIWGNDLRTDQAGLKYVRAGFGPEKGARKANLRPN